MKTRILSILLLVVTIFGNSCKEEKKEAPKPNPQMEKVMAIHDEVMPKMGTLGRLAGELKKAMEDSTQVASHAKYKEALTELQNANRSMMDWMRDFGTRFDPDEIFEGKELTEEKQIWLDEEEENVKELRNLINSSIEEAENSLGESQD